jgi:hypothetical protein
MILHYSLVTKRGVLIQAGFGSLPGPWYAVAVALDEDDKGGGDGEADVGSVGLLLWPLSLFVLVLSSRGRFLSGPLLLAPPLFGCPEDDDSTAIVLLSVLSVMAIICC